MENNLGSYPNELILSKLQPSYWFAAHLHVHYAAIVDHDMWKKGIYPASTQSILSRGNSNQPIVNNPEEIKINPDEIEISLSDDNYDDAPAENPPVSEVVSETPKVTKFLSLDKCLPRRQFLQVQKKISR